MIIHITWGFNLIVEFLFVYWYLMLVSVLEMLASPPTIKPANNIHRVRNNK